MPEHVLVHFDVVVPATGARIRAVLGQDARQFPDVSENVEEQVDTHCWVPSTTYRNFPAEQGSTVDIAHAPAESE